MIRAALALLLVVAAPATGGAQEITGTYIQYVSMNANGSWINSTTMRAMAYSESGMPPFTCDLYYPGTPAEVMTVVATAGATTVTAYNTGNGVTMIPTTAGPAVAGRTITWSGQLSMAPITLAIDEVVRFDSATDRHVTMEVTIRNTGTTGVTDLYFMRSGDPDHGNCNIGTSFFTNNDVLLQPPADGGALAVAHALGTPAVTFGMGAWDTRARANNSLFESHEAVTAWNTPMDAAGMSRDEDIAIVFKEPSLPAGGSTRFVIYYVWGPDPMTVRSRFDLLRCAAGTACDDGLYCTTGDVCDGLGGCAGTPRSCSDSLTCTTDTCDEAGDRCTSTVTSGCLIGGTCQAEGAANPMNACLLCTSADSRTTWSPARSGTTCSDGLYCTTTDRCNGAGMCAGSARSCSDMLACTGDFCDEAADRCANPISTGCVIGGACIASGTRNPANDCEECRPGSSATAWTARAGETCGSPSCTGATLTPAPTCSATGTCTPGTAVPCPSGMTCADAVSCSGGCSSDAECLESHHCNAGRCAPDLTVSSPCDREAMCETGSCASGVCCDRACDGTCEACDLAGTVGTCARDPVCMPDAGPPPDAGPGPDAGPVDAGPEPDAGRPVDAGPVPLVDSGPVRDSGPEADAGAVRDAGGRRDDSSGGYDVHGSGLFCAAIPASGGAPGAGALLLVLAALLSCLRARAASRTSTRRSGKR